MRRISWPAVVAIVVLGVAAFACDGGGAANDEAPAAALATPELGAQEPLEQDTQPRELDVLVDLQLARDNYSRRELELSADALGAASRKVRHAANQAVVESRPLIIATADSLDRMAFNVRAGSVTSTRDFDRMLAATNVSVARIHHRSARDAWARREAMATGREITKAADHVEQGTKRLGQDIGSGTMKVLRDARRVGQRLAARVEVSAADVGRTMRGLGNEIEKLAKDVTRRDVASTQ
jgi:hypothetical protein